MTPCSVRWFSVAFLVVCGLWHVLVSALPAAAASRDAPISSTFSPLVQPDTDAAHS